jgi:hypothetical protein
MKEMGKEKFLTKFYSKTWKAEAVAAGRRYDFMTQS